MSSTPSAIHPYHPVQRPFQRLTNYLVLGVSGHRDLLPTDTEYINGQEGRLEKLVRLKLEEMLVQQRAAGREGIVVVSPLAEGADCVVAWVAIQLQQQNKPIQLRVVLPYNLDAYESTLNDSHRQLLHAFINQTGGYALSDKDVRIPSPKDPPDQEHRRLTESAYRKYCEWLTTETDAILVLWDGVDTMKPGGTSDLVRIALQHPNSTKRLKVIHHLITPRQQNPFPLARYFGNQYHRVRQPGIIYQWYELPPRIDKSTSTLKQPFLKREGIWKFAIPAFVAISMLVFGIWGFQQYSGSCKSDVLDSIARSLNLATLGGIRPEGCSGIVEIPWQLYIARGFGIVLSIYAVFLVYLALFRNVLQWVKVAFWAAFWRGKNRYALVVGLTNQTYALLQDISRQFRAITVIDPDGKSPHQAAIRLLNVNLISGNPTDDALLKRAYLSDAQQVFIMTGNDDLNVRTAQQVDQLVSQETSHQWHVEVQDSRKRYLLNETVQQAKCLQPFSLVESMVRRLQIRYPIDRFYQTPSSFYSDVVIFGFGPVGQAITLNTLQLGHFAEASQIEQPVQRRVRIHVFTSNPETSETDFLSRYPFLAPLSVNEASLPADAKNLHQHQLRNLLFPKGTLTFYNLPNAETALLDKDFPLYGLFNPKTPVSQALLTIYVCLENPVKSVTLLSEVLPRLELFRYADRLRQQNPKTDIQVFCHYEIADEEEVDFTEKQVNRRAVYTPVIFFGKFSDECAFDAIRAQHEDQLAKQLALWYYLLYGERNQKVEEQLPMSWTLKDPNNPMNWAQTNYTRLLSHGKTDVLDKLAEICWQSLAEKDRASNRRAADHAWLKLRYLGLQTGATTVSGDDSVRAYLAQQQERLKKELNTLSQMEHRRWCAEKMLEGYTPLLDELPDQRAEVKEVEWRGERKAYWRRQKLHLDLDLFEHLSDFEKQKDHDQILGLPYLLLALGLELKGELTN